MSIGFPRQEYWSGLPFPALWDLPNPGIEPPSLVSPALAGEVFTAGELQQILKAKGPQIPTAKKEQPGD